MGYLVLCVFHPVRPKISLFNSMCVIVSLFVVSTNCTRSKRIKIQEHNVFINLRNIETERKPAKKDGEHEDECELNFVARGV